MKITIIAGSPRHGSISFRVAKYLYEYFCFHYPQYQFSLLDVRENPLPFVQNVWVTPQQVPVEYKTLAEKILGADAFLVVSPEYNGSYSPALKNLLDHFPKQHHKTFGIVTSSTGAMGGMRASQQLILLCAGLFGITCPQMLLVPNADQKFTESGELHDESFLKNIQTFSTAFLWLAEAVHQKKKEG